MARAMKDSGIEWIGEIPEGWMVSPVKNYIKWKSEKGYPDAQVLSLYRDYGIVPKDSRDDNHNVTSLDTSGYKFVEVGDLVINKMKAWQGSIAVSNYSGIVSPAYHVCQIVGDDIYKQYLHYLLRNPAYLPEYMRLSTGMRVGQWDLGFDDFKNIPIVLPDMLEQRRIVTFLDAECARIDAVIEQTRASIEEYKKLKQSVITQAVTHGIRQGRKMKDSGVEWIGEIPEEWQITKMKYISANIGDGLHAAPEFDEYGSYYFINGNNLGDKQIKIKNNTNSVSEEEYSNYNQPVLCLNAILIALNGTYGLVSFYQGEKIMLGKSAGFINLFPYINRSYVRFALLSDYSKKQMDDSLMGTTIANISLRSIRNLTITWPSENEQKEISLFLDSTCDELDRLLAKKIQVVNELESYKKSLIFEYVTGKKEVQV